MSPVDRACAICGAGPYVGDPDVYECGECHCPACTNCSAMVHDERVCETCATVTTWELCPECKGSGYYEEQTDVDHCNRFDCQQCHGNGEIQVKVERVRA